MTILLIILFWIICGIINFGVTFAYFQSEFFDIAKLQRKSDYMFSAIFGFLGIIGFISLIFMHIFKIDKPFKYGWRIR